MYIHIHTHTHSSMYVHTITYVCNVVLCYAITHNMRCMIWCIDGYIHNIVYMCMCYMTCNTVTCSSMLYWYGVYILYTTTYTYVSAVHNIWCNIHLYGVVYHMMCYTHSMCTQIHMLVCMNVCTSTSPHACTYVCSGTYVWYCSTCIHRCHSIYTLVYYVMWMLVCTCKYCTCLCASTHTVTHYHC